MSNAAVAELQKPRTEVFLNDGSITSLLVLGSTPGRLATMRISTPSDVAIVELHEHVGAMTVVGRRSIIELLEQEAQRGN